MGHEPGDAETRACREFELTARLSERLTEYDIERDIGDLPFSELVERLCRDMGIEAPWEIWEDQPWAQEEAKLGIAGSPYARPVVPGPAAAPMGPADSDRAVERPKPPSG